MKLINSRASGILMPIFSLPSDYGIGTLGEEAYKFADFLKNSGQKVWQILPIGQTSMHDSPYQSFSSYAGNPYFIDFDMLYEKGLLYKYEYKDINWGEERIDYFKIYSNRFDILRKSFERFKSKEQDEFEKFIKDNDFWLDDYALFMSLKGRFGMISFSLWQDDIKMRKEEELNKYKQILSEEIRFWKYMQYIFFDQWRKLKEYVNSLDICIIGDLPIYVSMDSADTWAHPEVFKIDEKFNPVKVAGCPPDAFSKTGQLWGNPIYNWDYLKKTKYKWWKDRIKFTSDLFDITRIDHFRGFASYYEIDCDAATAENGEWKKGPGIEFWNEIDDKGNIIAEDLGSFSKDTNELLELTGFPGMKVLEFAFDLDKSNPHMIYNHKFNSIAYIGTHDNDTAVGWLNSLTEDKLKLIREYINVGERDVNNWDLIRLVFSSVSELAIVQMQDVLGLSSEARINKPSTIGGNWTWRIKKGEINEELELKLKKITELYGRNT